LVRHSPFSVEVGPFQVRVIASQSSAKGPPSSGPPSPRLPPSRPASSAAAVELPLELPRAALEAELPPEPELAEALPAPDELAPAADKVVELPPGGTTSMPELPVEEAEEVDAATAAFPQPEADTSPPIHARAASSCFALTRGC
jgi:hypothetical protein